MTYRVLIVDDYEPWRRYVGSRLAHSSRWQVVGEAGDGGDAVQQAVALDPDSILLDIGLPTLDGIEAARRILAHIPTAKILFVSEHRLWDVAEAALGTGGSGYVVKTSAGTELQPAMEAVMRGQLFVSAELSGDGFVSAGRAVIPPPVHHEAGIYKDETTLLDDWVRLTQSVLGAGHTFVIVAVEARREKLRHRLQSCGVDVDLAMKEGRYLEHEAADALESWMIEGWPDEARIRSASAECSARVAGHLVLCGETSGLLISQGRKDAARRLEQLWDKISPDYGFDTFCTYLVDDRRFDRHDTVMRSICATHSITHTHGVGGPRVEGLV